MHPFAFPGGGGGGGDGGVGAREGGMPSRRSSQRTRSGTGSRCEHHCTPRRLGLAVISCSFLLLPASFLSSLPPLLSLTSLCFLPILSYVPFLYLLSFYCLLFSHPSFLSCSSSLPFLSRPWYRSFFPNLGTEVSSLLTPKYQGLCLT